MTRRVRRSLVVLVVTAVWIYVYGAASFAASTPWTGILAPARATDWSTAGVTGGIPNRTAICTTLNPGASAAQINSAIASCPSGQVVQLEAGNYTLANPLNLATSNVTLRGRGMATILTFPSCSGSSFQLYGGSVCVSMTGPGTNLSGYGNTVGLLGVPPGTVHNWVGTNGQSGVYTAGATVLNLDAAPTGLTVGGTLTMWQADPADATVPNSGYWMSDKSGTGINDVCNSGSGDFAANNAGTTQRVRVVAINGTAVTIAAPGIISGTWTKANNPKVGWQSGVLTGAGLENLQILHPANIGAVVGMMNAADSWVTGVGIGGALTSSDGISVVDSRNLTIRSNWLDAQVGGGLGQSTSYGFDPIQVSSSLFENNILNGVESPITPHGPMTGNVIAYNFENRHSDLEPLGAGGIQPHGEGVMMNLFEGNYAFKFYADKWHGATALNTLFRNHISGADVGVDLWSYNRWYNVIGNVIAANTVYKSVCTDPTAYTRWQGAALRLGYASQYGECQLDESGSKVLPDPVVTTSILLWGNYVAGDAAPHWLSSEVPSNDPVFPNAVPASQTLPASMYSTGRPSWWPTSKAWPPIGPDVTGGTSLAGHAYTTPAADCYAAAGGNMATFKPATCYASGSSISVPTAPTNLRIIR